jgi:hypothetical protein
MLTKALDLSARLKRPVKLPITPEDEKRTDDAYSRTIPQHQARR